MNGLQRQNLCNSRLSVKLSDTGAKPSPPTQCRHERGGHGGSSNHAGRRSPAPGQRCTTGTTSVMDSQPRDGLRHLPAPAGDASLTVVTRNAARPPGGTPAMSSPAFDLTRLFGTGLPDPSPRFAGFPQFNFIGGHNDPEQIPIEGLIEAATSVLRREGASLAMYNLGRGPQGYPGLRDFLAGKLKRHRGMACGRDDIMITTGSGQGIDMVSRLLVDPGETVILEECCYAGAISRFKKVGARIVGAKLDEHGIRIDALTATLDELKAQGVTPKCIYTIPTIQNPTGSIMPLERRKALLALARERGIAIFEDECYADLLWVRAAPPALYALAPDQVVHIGSFSKSLAPALRVGYCVASWPVLSRLLAMKSDSGTGALDQMIVAEYL